MKTSLNLDAQRSHATRNTIHTALLVGGTAALMGVLAYTVFGWIGLIIAAIVCYFGMMSLRNISPQMVLKLYKAEPLPRSELPDLHDTVEALARRANLPAVPKLYYVRSKMLNAFAVGTRENAAIAVTDGLLRAVNMRQLAGILAHETAHVMNGDLRVMGIADVLNRITSFMSNLGIMGMLGIFGFGLKLPLLGAVLLIAAPTIGSLLQLGLSRAREYDADADGVALTGDPEGLASALRLLEERQTRNWEGFVLPGSRLPQPSLLRTHPKTEDRIARLRALAGLPDQEVVFQPERRPQPSFVPPVRNPRIQWQRLGVYY